MHARVAKFEGADPAMQDRMAAMIKEEGRPPEGVEGRRIQLLADRSSGVTYVIVTFANEEDMRAGDAVLNALEPPPDANAGRRTSVELCEILVEETGPAGL
jgi:hypothetical protein